MLNRILRWIFGPSREDRTLGQDLHWAWRGSHDKILRDLQPLDHAWLERHNNS